MLTVDKLNVEIEGTRVLRDLSLSLRSGVCTVLIGRNGAGKTTTLRSIMGLIPRISGTVVLEGREIQDLPANRRAGMGIGYAPEDRRLIPDFSIEENILLPTLALKLPAEERRERLNQVFDFLPQLKDLRARPGGGVSGGQGKMVALGRALTVADKVLFLDEPFQGLAPALALEYARTLSRLRKYRPDLALLITESTPALLREVADEELQIERGEILQTATA
ncbi:ATP-binding cassette domain-containing protein [Pseudodonghicola flavimaris]|uniref:ATP-binding cassette domain-containing protein n=1 Tax=Pseudodonghicola flavimaris TaxID=3050036 RepID=A0ABT7F2N1_9RHOB|nr:ATP-binding cassette domain-containing protein [Pseudodonghicola flavimaris]MDK3018853.1 ATP-binding cassette domain-containing protein [Pseudodonghicola flavimaris]